MAEPADGSFESVFRRKKGEKEKTVVEAIKSKYCADMSDLQTQGLVIVFHGRPKKASEEELGYLRNVVLSNYGLTSSGIVGSNLSTMCPNVVELDLSGNHFETWQEIFPILEQLKALKFLNLAHNNIQDPEGALESWTGELPRLENLVLNSTRLDWSVILKIVKLMEHLKELHLCENGYKELPDTDLDSLHSLHCLRLNDNNITRWSEIWKISPLPNLTTLILSGNPLEDIFYEETEGSDVCQDCLAATDCDTASVERTDNSDTCDPKPSVDSTVQEADPAGIAIQSDVEDKRDTIAPDSKTIEAFSVKDVEFKADTTADDSKTIEDCPERAVETIADTIADNSKTIEDTAARDVETEADTMTCDSKSVEDSSTTGDVEDNNALTGSETPTSLTVPTCDVEAKGETKMGSTGSKLIRDAEAEVCIAGSKSESGETTQTDLVTETDAAAPIDAHGFEKKRVVTDNDSKIVDVSKPSDAKTGDGTYPEDCKLGETNSTTDAKTDCASEDAKNGTTTLTYESKPSDTSAALATLAEKANLDSNPGKCADVPSETAKTGEETTIVAEKIPNDVSGVGHVVDKPKFCAFVLSNDGVAMSESEQQTVIRKPKFMNLGKKRAELPNSARKNTKKGEHASATKDKSKVLKTGSATHKNKTPRADSRQTYTPSGTKKVPKTNESIKPNTETKPELSGASLCRQCSISVIKKPFDKLETLCVSKTKLSQWKHVTTLNSFPALKAVRIMGIELASDLKQEDRRKLFMASLQKIQHLNGSRVEETEREKSERHLLRHFCDKEDKPDVYPELEQKHGILKPLVDVDIGRGFKNTVTLTIVMRGQNKRWKETVSTKSSSRQLVEMISRKTKDARLKFVPMLHRYTGPYHPPADDGSTGIQEEELLRTTGPISRYDVMDGDEIVFLN